MSALKNPAFTFKSQALAPDAFEVFSFSGEEGISSLYHFDILLVSKERDIDAAAVFQKIGTFTIHPPFAGDKEQVYTGIVTSFICLHQVGEMFFYRVELRHKLWRLDCISQCRVFVDKAPTDFLPEALEGDEMFSGMDFKMNCTGSYRSRDFICQYNESTFAFFSRWLEYLGIYYWFEHSSDGGTCVVGDNKSVHAPVPGFETCRYSPPSGMQTGKDELLITHFSRESRPLPKEVRLKTYNSQKPDLDLTCTSPVKRDGNGVYYIYGDTYLNKEEGEALADIRAEELLCREHIFTGTSHIPGLRPGYLFKLDHHFRRDWNQNYLTTRVSHEGSQSRLVVRTYSLNSVDDVDRLYYRNTFTCIPASVQYRPERVTPWPRVSGSLPAIIDAEGSGGYAVLDGQGRYKVRLPFDTAGRGGGKASCWVSMMQPYAGDGMGFQAPLHKGTEVMLNFVDGNPDQPVISGAVPNPQTKSPVTDANAAEIKLSSASGFNFAIDDTAGKNNMMLSTPGGKSFIKLGTE